MGGKKNKKNKDKVLKDGVTSPVSKLFIYFLSNFQNDKTHD